MVSTDKANPPTWGLQTSFCEMIVQDMATRSEYTKFVAVRFGNGCGSVIPLFKKQIAEGGPPMQTHPDIVRYLMIPEVKAISN